MDPNRAPEVYNLTGSEEYNAPAASWEDRALRQATVTVTMDRSLVQSLVQPSIPFINPGPQMHRPATGVLDCIDVTRQTPDRRTSFSGSIGGYSGATRDGWSGLT